MDDKHEVITLDEEHYVEVRGACEIAIGVYRLVGDAVMAAHYEEVLNHLDRLWEIACGRVPTPTTGA